MRHLTIDLTFSVKRFIFVGMKEGIISLRGSISQT